MTILNKLNHSVDINNPTWSSGSKTDVWTEGVASFVTKVKRTIRDATGDHVASSTVVILGPTSTVNPDSEIRLNGETDAHPVVNIARIRKARTTNIHHIEVTLG